MKNLVTSLALIGVLFGFSQSKTTHQIDNDDMVRVENVSVTITVDSAEEILSSFKVEDIKEVLETSSANEIVSFKIICNGEKMSSGVKSHVSYKIEGNSNDMEAFLFGIEKIRKAALNYYNNK